MSQPSDYLVLVSAVLTASLFSATGCSSSNAADAIINGGIDATASDSAGIHDAAAGTDGSSSGLDGMSGGQDAASGQDAAPGQDGSQGGPDSGTQGQDSGMMMGGNDGGGGGPDSGPHPSPGVCVPDPTGTGNSMHVGAYCSRGNGECQQYGLSCAIDLDSMGGNFCIKVVFTGSCNNTTDCGEMACCTGRAGNPIKACVPLGCVADDAGACPM